MKKLTVEGIRESARKIHYGAGHDAVLFLLEELDNAKKVQTVTDQSWRKLMEEREKLIEGLRKLGKTNAENINEIRAWKIQQADPDVIDLDWYNHIAKSILKSIGIDV